MWVLVWLWERREGEWGERTGLAGAVVEVLAGEVEVELLQLKGLVGDLQGAALGDDLDGGAQVLKLGAFGHVVDAQLDVGPLENGEHAVDHVDWGLVGAGCAHAVGRGLERSPVERALDSASAEVSPYMLLGGIIRCYRCTRMFPP